MVAPNGFRPVEWSRGAHLFLRKWSTLTFASGYLAVCSVQRLDYWSKKFSLHPLRWMKGEDPV